MHYNFRKAKKEAEMANVDIEKVVKEIFDEVRESIAVSIVRLEDGMDISSHSTMEDFDPAVASAAYASVIKSHFEAVELIGPKLVGETEDILFTMENIYILLRLIGEKHFIIIAITKKGNLSLARVQMKKYEPLFVQALKELGEL